VIVNRAERIRIIRQNTPDNDISLVFIHCR
jgi:hypothetical protein